MYIVHLSASEALDEVMGARDRGQSVFAETCPQYLFLSDEDLARDGFEGAKYVCSPPLRPQHHQGDLWRGLRTDDLSLVSTDHCPFCFKEQKELGIGDFSKIPNGMPGVEHRMDLIFQGVHRGELSLERWVDVTSTTPARMFGLDRRKGSLRAGLDADVVVFDPRATRRLSAATLHSRAGHTPYEGMEVAGWPALTLSRGRVVARDGEPFEATPGWGRFVPRSKSLATPGTAH